MTTSMKSGIIGAAIGIAIAIAGVLVYNHIHSQDTVGTTQGTTVTKTDNDGKITPPPVIKPVEKPVEKHEPMKPVEKKTIKPQAVDRVFPKIIKGQLEMTGRGSDAKWGIAQTANFKCTTVIVADSEIISKEAQKNGVIKVIEKRTFNTVQDSLIVSDVDLKLSLKTLPIETLSKVIDFAATAYGSISGDTETAKNIIDSKDIGVKTLQSVDGFGARKLLGWFGFQPTPDIEEQLNKLGQARFRQALGVVRSISGKSYIITYYQEKSGQPLMITFKYADGREITNEEEKMILRRVNAFLDYHVVPDSDCRPGNSWKINAEDVQEIMDPFVNGDYSGSVTATRRSNADNGDWVIEFAPSQINVISNGNTNGSLNLKEGKAQVNPEKLSVNDMFIKGDAKLEKASQHHLLFTARVEGSCDFEGRIITTSKEQ